MRILLLGLTVLVFTGCETNLNHNVIFMGTAMNHTLPIEVDASQMPPDWIETITIDSDSFGNKKQVYRLRGPARITVTPAEDLYDR